MNTTVIPPSLLDVDFPAGSVALVGAGPGDPGLLDPARLGPAATGRGGGLRPPARRLRESLMNTTVIPPSLLDVDFPAGSVALVG
ncbi:hypothetical protein ACLXAZ_33320, partial [Escherichia coli]